MLENLSKEKLALPCKIIRLRQGLEPTDQKRLDDALIDNEWPSATLAKQLTALGLGVSGHVIANHRKGICSCSKS